MKRRRISILLAMIALLVPLVASAQNVGGAGSAEGANKQEIAAKLEKISAALQLTPQQKQQLLPILKEEAPQLEAVKNNASLGPLQKAMQLKQIGQATDTKVQPILTAEQWQKWQVMRAQEREQMMQKMESR